MRECTANRRLARTRWTVQQHAALWAEPKFGSQGIIRERQNDMNFRAAHDIIDALQVMKSNFLDFVKSTLLANRCDRRYSMN